MDKITKYIMESKQRCHSMGMDPDIIPSFSCLLDEEELLKKRQDYEEILEVISFFVNKMLQYMKGIPLLMMVTDDRGCILEMAGDETIKKLIQQLGINIGRQFKEDDAGTNAISLSLQHHAPFQLIGSDHYHSFLSASACYTVPFAYTDENIILGTVTVMTDIEHHYPFTMGMLCTVVDTIDRELLLRKKNKRLHLLNQIVINSTNNAIIVTDKTGNITEYNEFAERLTGWKKHEVIGQDVHHFDPMGKYFHHLLHTGERCEDIELTFKRDNIPDKRVCLFDALPIYDENNELMGAFGQFRDITERHEANEKINYMAYHDDLTGLPNRRFFYKRLRERLNYAEINKGMFSVIFLDIDRFKIINDTFGHSNGDQVLQLVAKKLERCMESQGMIARMGGDEFTILLPEISQLNEAVSFAEKLILQFEDPITIDQNEVYVTTSIGVVVYPHDGNDAETLMKHADTAMYQAKEQGKNNYVVYKPLHTKNGLDRLTLESYLRKALQNDEFILYYQPQINLVSGEIVGLEALIRWSHPILGMVSPGVFIPLAEEIGLIVQIGDWVLKKACEQNKEWQRQGLPPVKVSVNLSSRQFTNSNLAGSIKQVLRESGLDPCYLGLEITESMTMDVDYAVETLRELKQLGVEVSVDDFGTGYSSLYYLKKLSIDCLKIDQSFVRGIMTDTNDANIVSTIIVMAHKLGIRAIAEGVETGDQLQFLREHHCNEVQGYYYYPPLPAEEVGKLLGEGLKS